MINNRRIIILSPVDSLCNITLNCILWAFNCFFFLLGAYFLINYNEDLNKEYGIQDCGNVFTGISCLTANCLVIIVFIPRALILSIIAFCSSMFLAAYNSYNIYTISHNCSSYYKQNYNNIWLYYTFGLALLYTNILLFVIKALTFCCRKNKNINNSNNQYINEADNNDRQPLLENESNIQYNQSINSTINQNNSLIDRPTQQPWGIQQSNEHTYPRSNMYPDIYEGESN